jgi:hypothetical protein
MARAHNHMVHKNLAAVLQKMSMMDFPAGPGQSVLDRFMVGLGSEVGTNHSVVQMFHGIAGGAGRFKMGVNSTDRIPAINFYSAIGKVFGLTKVGDGMGYTGDAAITT